MRAIGAAQNSAHMLGLFVWWHPTLSDPMRSQIKLLMHHGLIFRRGAQRSICAVAQGRADVTTALQLDASVLPNVRGGSGRWATDR